MNFRTRTANKTVMVRYNEETEIKELLKCWMRLEKKYTNWGKVRPIPMMMETSKGYKNIPSAIIFYLHKLRGNRYTVMSKVYYDYLESVYQCFTGIPPKINQFSPGKWGLKTKAALHYEHEYIPAWIQQYDDEYFSKVPLDFRVYDGMGKLKSNITPPEVDNRRWDKAGKSIDPRKVKRAKREI